jgi:hypothetical protein
MKLLRLVPILALILLAACAPPRTAKDYTKFRSEDPASLLVVPVVNRTVDVTAADYFLSTLTMPVAERGYYVYPVFLVKRLLEDDGLADAALVHSADPRRLGAIFGADAILYVTINKWNAKYAVFSTSVEVEFDYVIKSGKTGEELWKSHEAMVYVPQSQNTGNAIGNLVAMAVTASMAKASPNYMPLARTANHNAFWRDHQGLPAGPHLDQHGKDKEAF